MSLNIKIESVAGVLLADGWHEVKNNSFTIDAYEFSTGSIKTDDWIALLGGGDEELITKRGAGWNEGARYICCPLSSILAVKI